MRKIFLTLTLILFMVSQVHAFDPLLIFSGSVVAGGETSLPCTGSNTFIGSPGNWESFEYGADDFCNSDISILDTDGIINTQDSAWAKCGSSSVSIAYTAMEADNYILVDLGVTPDTAYRVVFYFKISAEISDWTLVRFFHIGNGPASFDGANMNLELKRAGYNMRLQATPGDVQNGETLSANTVYRIEIDFVKNDTTTITIFDSVDSQVGTDITVTAGDNTGRYMTLGPIYGNNQTQTLYFDAFQYHGSGAADLGPVDCSP